MRNNDHDEWQDKLAVLITIRNKYQRFIESDNILNRDFDRLINYLTADQSLSISYYEKIMSHLIAESAQIVEDDDRISDESPLSLTIDSDAPRHLKEHRELKRDLEACFIQQAEHVEG